MYEIIWLYLYKNNLNMESFKDTKVVVVKDSLHQQDFLDTRLYITLHSPLEELLASIPKTTVKGMFQGRDEKQVAMKDALKIFTFQKTIDDKYCKEPTECSDDMNMLKEKSMLYCADVREYLKLLCKEACRFVVSGHDSMQLIINNSERDLNALRVVRQKYIYRNSRVVDKEYNDRILSLSTKFEDDLSQITSNEFCPHLQREEISKKGKELQILFLEFSKTIPKKEIRYIKYSHEHDFYGIEQEISKLFETYADKWSNSLL
jgi:hypothetical protein